MALWKTPKERALVAAERAAQRPAVRVRVAYADERARLTGAVTPNAPATSPHG